MPRKRRKKQVKVPENIRKIQENSLNLIPSLAIGDDTFLGFKLKGINQLWRWDTLEDVKL